MNALEPAPPILESKHQITRPSHHRESSRLPTRNVVRTAGVPPTGRHKIRFDHQSKVH